MSPCNDVTIKDNNYMVFDSLFLNIISINLLEYAVVMINYAIVTKIITDQNICKKFKYQSLLNWSDNKTAISWTKKLLFPPIKAKHYHAFFAPFV